ncbi:PPOX class probable F420-dependent enzyme [Saccharomonospora glauca K62]|uniref:PPOX class probable F420-dependent enzyme n=2 Tax=Saccharomonospora glauca TaxID=40990 RepID=I1D188_9PSEU|nr:PPOX class probable F420-dependent enzyme [Saccharomonospora glauca K62]
MYAMARDEWWSFASEGTRTGKLAVVTARGAPHVTPVWFVLTDHDGDAFVFTTGADSVKARALRRDPRVCMVVDDQRPPFAYVQFTAEADVSDDVTDMVTWARRIGERYMGAERAEEFGRRNAVPGELLVTARVTKVLAYAAIAD